MRVVLLVIRFCTKLCHHFVGTLSSFCEHFVVILWILCYYIVVGPSISVACIHRNDDRPISTLVSLSMHQISPKRTSIKQLTNLCLSPQSITFIGCLLTHLTLTDPSMTFHGWVPPGDGLGLKWEYNRGTAPVQHWQSYHRLLYQSYNLFL